MLTLTDNATSEIRGIIDDPAAPDGCGVRIATTPRSDELSLSVAEVPAEDDEILDENGARVFLEPRAATLLADRALDATIDSTGRVSFSIIDPASY
jgi:Fe-S cluster assembly iron-binding protein IscA